MITQGRVWGWAALGLALALVSSGASAQSTDGSQRLNVVSGGFTIDYSHAIDACVTEYIQIGAGGANVHERTVGDHRQRIETRIVRIVRTTEDWCTFNFTYSTGESFMTVTRQSYEGEAADQFGEGTVAYTLHRSECGDLAHSSVVEKSGRDVKTTSAGGHESGWLYMSEVPPPVKIKPLGGIDDCETGASWEKYTDGGRIVGSVPLFTTSEFGYLEVFAGDIDLDLTLVATAPASITADRVNKEMLRRYLDGVLIEEVEQPSPDSKERLNADVLTQPMAVEGFFAIAGTPIDLSSSTAVFQNANVIVRVRPIVE